jgi:hypothetical protein
VQRQLFRDQTRRMGLRWTEALRDTLRPGWFRVRRSRADDPPVTGQGER